MRVYEIIKQLESEGYKFSLKPGPKVDAELKPDYPEPDPEKVEPLFQKLKQNKRKVVRILKNREMLSPIPDWFIIKSHLLNGEKILIKKDGSVKAPYKYRSFEEYTLLECKAMLEDGTVGEDLKKLHKIKKEFNGTLILGNEEIIKK